MKLMDVIESHPENTIFHVGSQSSWFFIGNRESFEHHIDRISNRYRFYIEREIDTFKTSLRIARGKLNTVRDEYDRNALRGQITTYRARLEALNEAYETTKKAPSMRDREVVDICTNILDGGINIKLEGWEQGRYWTLDEWRARHEI